MVLEKAQSPFKIGDRLVFSPDGRTVGWTWPTFERVRLKPGDSGVVTEIKNGVYIYLDDGRGGFHWECFKRATQRVGMKKGVKAAFLTLTAIAATSSLLFLKQGGFGGGHGDFDEAVFVLGLPWTAISWPPIIAKHDFIWLIGLPFTLNIASVIVVAAVVALMRREQQHDHL
jgi:hypothetical protein